MNGYLNSESKVRLNLFLATNPELKVAALTQCNCHLINKHHETIPVFNAMNEA